MNDRKDWSAYFPDDSQTIDDATWIMNVKTADEAAYEAVEYDWSSRDGWERGETAQGFPVVVVSPDGEEFHYIGSHEPAVNHRAVRKRQV